MIRIAVIIAAAGNGERFGGVLPKQYLQISNQMILTKTIEKFISHPDIHLVIASIGGEHLPLYNQAISDITDPSKKLLAPVFGENERHLSVLNALNALAQHKPDIVLIQDGCRPFVSHQLISSIIEATNKHGAAIPLIPSFETLKEVRDNFICKTLDRSKIYKSQTPQGFDFQTMLDLATNNEQSVTDDAQIFEKAGKKIFVVPGEVANIKITFKEDLG